MKEVSYVSAVGNLMYAMVCTRLDIAHPNCVVNRFLSNPGKEHQTAVKQIIRYLIGTSKAFLCFDGDKLVLQTFLDVDMARDVDSRKSLSGYLLTFARGSVSWQSKLQKCVALSITEAKYIAISGSCKKALQMKNCLQELGVKQDSYIVYCDNHSVVHLAKNSTYQLKSKYIDMRYHWIRDVLKKK